MPSQFSSKRERCLWTLGQLQQKATESQPHVTNTFNELSLKLVQGLFQRHCQDHRGASQLFRAVLELSERFCDPAALEDVYDLAATICSEEVSRQRHEQAARRATSKGYPSPPAPDADRHRHPTPPGTPRPYGQARVDDWFATLDRHARSAALHGDGLLPPEPDGLLPPEAAQQVPTPEPAPAAAPAGASPPTSSHRKRRAVSEPGDAPPRKHVGSIPAAGVPKRKREDDGEPARPVKRERLQHSPSVLGKRRDLDDDSDRPAKRERRQHSPSILGKRRDLDDEPERAPRSEQGGPVQSTERSVKKLRLADVPQPKAGLFSARVVLSEDGKRRRRSRSLDR